LTLTDKANSTSGDWGDDGYVYFEVDSGIARIRPSGGGIESVYTMSKEQNEVGTEWPNVLPGASGIIFRVRRSAQAPTDFTIVAMKLPHGPAKTLTRGVYARYAPSGHLLVVTADGKLIAIPFDPKKLELTGPPIALLEGVGVRTAGFNIDLVVSANGTLVYTTGGTLGSRRAVWVSREGTATTVDPAWDPQGVIESAVMSPDGKALAVSLTRSSKTDIWVKQLPTGPFSRITFGDTNSVRPTWAPDSRSVLYINDRSGSNVGSVYTHRADGTGTASLVFRSSRDFGQVAESGDGRWLLLRSAVNTTGGGDIFGARQGDTTLVPLVSSPATDLFPALSPDGRWLAYGSDESGTMEVYVRPFPETATAKWQVSSSGGSEPVWSKSGRQLYYINGKTELVAADIKSVPTFSVEQQRVLFSMAPFVRQGSIQSYDVTADESRFLMVREGEPSQQSELIVAENWLETLKGKVGH